MSRLISRCFSSLYSFGLGVGLMFFAPRILRNWLKGELLLNRKLVPLEKREGPVIWVHAVSFGETKAAVPLLHMLKRKFPRTHFVLSTVTSTGYAEGKRAFPQAARRLYLPWDFQKTMKRAMQALQPDLILLTETDYWYHFLKEGRKSGAKVLVVNGKISAKSARRYQKIPWLSRALFSQVDHFCVQNAQYAERFTELGVEKSKLTITGNMKFDANHPALSAEERGALQKRLGIQKDEIILVAGSTHHPEESLILSACQALWKQGKRVRLLLAPRHPQRFEEVADLLTKMQIPFSRYSRSEDCSSTACCVLIDAMGHLLSCYQLADIAIVAGSFTPKVGGHNILEPCFCAVPVLFGTYMHAQPELCACVLEANAGQQVSSEQLASVLLEWIEHPLKREQMGKRGKQLMEQNSGALHRTFERIISECDSLLSL